MNKTEIIVGILSGLLIVGIIVLTALEKEITQLLPLLGITLGYLVGAKQEVLLGLISKKKKK